MIEQYIADRINQAVKQKLNSPVVCINTSYRGSVNNKHIFITQGSYFSEPIIQKEHTESVTVIDGWWNQFKSSFFGSLFNVRIATYTKKYSLVLYKIPKEIMKINENKLYNKDVVRLSIGQYSEEFGVEMVEHTVNRIVNNVEYDIDLPANASEDAIAVILSKQLSGLSVNIINEFNSFFSNNSIHELSNQIETPSNWYQALLLKLNKNRKVKTTVHKSSSQITIKTLISGQYDPYDYYHLKVTEI